MEAALALRPTATMGVNAPAAQTTLLVADGSCPKIRELLAEALVPVFWLDDDQDPLEVVTAALAERRRQGQPVETLHWVSHGRPGVLKVGGVNVDRASLLKAEPLLANWHVSDVALWACQTGKDATFIRLLEELTAGTVWSSQTPLGQLDNDSHNWNLYTNKSNAKKQISLPANPVSLKTWRHQLSARTGVITFDDTSGNGGVFLGNEYLELGVNANGYFGTTAKTESDLTDEGFEGRQGGLADGIGLVGDADGFGGAGEDLRIDYFLPGSPEERWGISYTYNDGTQKSYSLGGIKNTGGVGGITDEFSTGNPTVTTASTLSVSPTPTAPAGTTQATATYTIGIDNLDITITYTLESGEKNYATDIQVTNNSGASISDIVFMRSFDPDNTLDLVPAADVVPSDYETTNKIISQYSGPGTASAVSSTSKDGDAYDTLAKDQAVIAYRSESDNSSVYLGGFANTNPAEWLPTAPASIPNPNGPLAPPYTRTDTAGSSVTEDSAIGIVFDIGTLAPGATSSFSYEMLLGTLADLAAFSEPDNNIVEDSGNNENVVTAVVDPNVSLNVEGIDDLAQSATDAISTLTSAIDRRDSTEETSLIQAATRFLNQLPPTSKVDVRTIIPTTTSTNDQTIALTGTTNSDGDSQTEAFVIDLRQMTGRTQLQLDNIAFTVIIGPADITGGAGSNHLIADDSNQFILLGDNDDTLVGGGGDDLLIGGRGQDVIRGGSDNDTLKGGSQADLLIGKAGDDLLSGGQGRDTLRGSSGDDQLKGHEANDSLHGGSGDDTLFGGKGSDTLVGGKGTDTLVGGKGTDTFSLSKGKDVIRDFSIAEGDLITAPEEWSLQLIQKGDHLLLKDNDNNIRTRLLNIDSDDFLNHQPDVIA